MSDDFKFGLKVFIGFCVWLIFIVSVNGIQTRYISEKKKQDIYEACQKVEKEYQIQAISNNFAHWEVDMSGKTTFKWNVQTNNMEGK